MNKTKQKLKTIKKIVIQKEKNVCNMVDNFQMLYNIKLQ
jgi:hypothetical protein